MKYNIYLDSSNKNFYISIFNNNLNIYNVFNNNGLHSDKIVNQFFDFIEKNNINLNDVLAFYISNGPGSEIGLYSLFTLIKLILIKFPKIEIYKSNSFDIQRLFDNDVVSTLKVSKLKSLSFYKNDVYINKNFDNKRQCQNYENIDFFLKNINKYKNKFTIIKNMNNLKIWSRNE